MNSQMLNTVNYIDSDKAKTILDIIKSLLKEVVARYTM
jgi:hypothetical protein